MTDILIVPEGCTLSEYTKETINKIKDFFFENGLVVNVDNICDTEWMNEQKPYFTVLDINGIARISSINSKSKSVKDVVKILKTKITKSDSEVFYHDLANETTLTIYFYLNFEKIRIELPYCTIKNIVNKM